MTTKIDYLNPITKSSDLSELMTSNFGPRNPKVGSQNHAGLDYRAKTPIPVYSAAEGNILKTGYSASFGNYVVVEHSNGQSTLYAHLSENSFFKVGEYVDSGIQIGTSGNTGVGTGPHLHFEVLTPEATQKISETKYASGSLGIKGSQYRENPLAADTSNGKSKQPTPSGDTPIPPLLQKAIDAEKASQAGLEGHSGTQSQADGQLQTGQESQTNTSSTTATTQVSDPSTPSALSTFSSGVMESMQNQFKSSMPTIIARLALGEDLDKICLDMAARITLSSVTDQALVQAGISSHSVMGATATALSSFAASSIIMNNLYGGQSMKSKDYAIAAANISVQTIANEVAIRLQGEAAMQIAKTTAYNTAYAKAIQTMGADAASKVANDAALKAAPPLSPAAAGTVAAVVNIVMNVAQNGLPKNQEGYENLVAQSASAFAIAGACAMLPGAGWAVAAGVVIGAIVSQPLTNYFDESIDNAQEALRGVEDSFKDLLKGNIDDAIKGYLKNIGDFAANSFKSVVHFFEGLGKSIKGLFGSDAPPPPPLFTIQQKEDGTGQILYSLHDGRTLLLTGNGTDDAVGTDAGETLAGNNAANLLFAKAGNDYLYGLGGKDTLVAGDGDDNLNGGEDDDILDGGSGSDYIVGGNGADTIAGGDGSDKIYGDNDKTTPTLLEGNDQIDAGRGNDEVYTGGGDDIVQGYSGNDTIFGMDGKDTIDGGTGDDTIDGGEGNDVISGGQDGVLNQDANGNYTGYTDIAKARQDIATLEPQIPDTKNKYNAAVAGLNTYILQNTIHRWYGNSFIGSAEIRNQKQAIVDTAKAKLDETIKTVESAKQLIIDIELSGNDIINGGNGNDQIFGFSGNDTLSGGDGNDVILAGYGSDTIDGGSGGDTIYADDDEEAYFNALSATDLLPSEFSPAFVNGDDTINSGAGDDTVFLIEGSDTVNLGDGSDTLQNQYANTRVYAGDGNDNIESIAGDNVIYGEGGNDTIKLGFGDDRVYGGEGGDNITTGDGDDYVEGNTGDDILTSGAGDDIVLGGDGSDVIQDDSGLNTLDGGTGDDYIIGGSNADTIITGVGNDNVFAGAGDDVIEVSSQTAKLTGSDGNDTYKIQNLAGNITINDLGIAADIDTIEFEASKLGSLKMVQDSNDLVISFTGQTGKVVVQNQFAADKTSRIETLKFGDVLLNITSFIVGTAGSDKIIGTDIDDAMLGTDVKDVIFGGAGNDFIDGGAGDDAIYGESGNDVIKGSGDKDIIFGGTGDDTLIGNEGDDILEGGAGRDTFIITKPSDIDTITDFTTGQDRLDLTQYSQFSSLKTLQYFSKTITQNGNDLQINIDGQSSVNLQNQSLANLMQAGNFIFNSKVSGLATDGNDILNGTAGSDVISDGKGSDIITGGAGSNTFKITQNAGDIDTITDFNAAQDKIDLSLASNYVDILQLDITQKNGDTIISLDDNQKILLENVKADSLLAQNFNFNIFNGLPQVQRYSGNIDYDFSQDNVIEQTTSAIAGSGMDTALFEKLIASGIGYNSSNLWNSENIWTEGVSHILANNEYYYETGGKHSHNELARPTTFNGVDEHDYRVRVGGMWWRPKYKTEHDNGNDRMYGAWWSETINAGSGNDEVYAGAGDDKVYAGTGNDYVDGGTGDDKLYGESGNDALYGGDGNDYLDGGADNDYLNGGSGNDTMLGGYGSDFLEDTQGNNIFDGGYGNDKIVAGSGNDIIYGGQGNDSIIAGDGNDFIDGDGSAFQRWATRQGGYWDSQKWFAGDFNGDGKDDIGKVFNDRGNASTDIHYSNGYSFNISRIETRVGGFWNSQKWIVGDYNGDGKDDLANVFNHGGSASIDLHLSNGYSMTSFRSVTKQGGYWDSQKWFAGDFNGDGRSDLAKVFNDGGLATIDVHLSNTNNTFSIQRWATRQGGYWDSQKWFVGDFNGDGKDDIGKVFNDGGSATTDIHYSNGFSFGISRAETRAGGFWESQKWIVGDYNGDGKDDLANVFNDGGFGSADIHYSTGNSLYLTKEYTKASGGFDDAHKWLSGDFNGDGKQELTKIFNDGGYGSADVQIATSGNDYIDAGSGDDTVRDMGGDNLVYLGTGNDTANLGTGNDYIDGGDGNDRIYSGGGNDTVITGSGNDYVVSGAGFDLVQAASGLNWMNGGAGNDNLQGGIDADIIYGGSGEDTIYGNEGSDLIVSGTNNDTVYGGDGADDISLGQGDDTASGEAGNDLIKGEDGNDTIYGNDGNDSISGGNNDDKLYGNAGNDTIAGDAGNDYIEGGEGSDILSGGDGDDKLYGGNGYNVLLGGAGSDILIFNKNDKFRDVVYGLDATDKIDISTYTEYTSILQLKRDAKAVFGSDVIRFADGNQIALKGSSVAKLSENQFYLNNYNSSVKEVEANPSAETSYAKTTDFYDNTAITSVDKTNWFSGHNVQTESSISLMVKKFTIAQSGANGWNNTLIGNSRSEWLLGGNMDDYINGNDGNDIIDGKDGNDIIYGGNGFDVIAGGSGNDLVYGGNDNDIITGGDGNDVLNGDDGNDEIHGNTGNDFVSGGEGNDKLYGEDGEDQIEGNNGDDYIETGAGNDIASGGFGADTIYLSLGNDFASGGSGRDYIEGEGGNDQIFGDAGNDKLCGGLGDDYILGGENNDLIYGGDGNDIILGDDGADVLYDGLGDDIILGGEGDDVFYIGGGKDLITGGNGRDIFSFESLVSSSNTNLDYILDFTKGEDTIDLSGLGIASFNNLNITNDGIDTMVMDNNSAFVFKLSGVHLLSQDDFMMPQS